MGGVLPSLPYRFYVWCLDTEPLTALSVLYFAEYRVAKVKLSRYHHAGGKGGENTHS
jgi:hypothetical protein